MGLADRFYRQATTASEAYSGEHIDLIGRAAAIGAITFRLTEGLVPPNAHMTDGGGDEGAKLPPNFLVALTPTRLRVLDYSQSLTNVKIKRELGAFPREGLELAVEDRGLMKVFDVKGADGSAFTFQMGRGKATAGFATSLSAALG